MGPSLDKQSVTVTVAFTQPSGSWQQYPYSILIVFRHTNKAEAWSRQPPSTFQPGNRNTSCGTGIASQAILPPGRASLFQDSRNQNSKPGVCDMRCMESSALSLYCLSDGPALLGVGNGARVTIAQRKVGGVRRLSLVGCCCIGRVVAIVHQSSIFLFTLGIDLVDGCNL
ncbi:hypothetical protein BDW69DRAFT_83289 [Aspergillus filifer]